MRKSVERFAKVTFNSDNHMWVVQYCNRQCELFGSSSRGYQIFFTEDRARKSAALWENKGCTLTTERTYKKPKFKR